MSQVPGEGRRRRARSATTSTARTVHPSSRRVTGYSMRATRSNMPRSSSTRRTNGSRSAQGATCSSQSVSAIVISVVVLSSLIFVKALFVIISNIAVLGAGVGVLELVRAFQHGGRRVDVVPQLAAVVLILLPAYFLDAWVHWTAIFLAVAAIVVWRLLLRADDRPDGRSAGDAVMGNDVLASGLIAVARAAAGKWRPRPASGGARRVLDHGVHRDRDRRRHRRICFRPHFRQAQDGAPDQPEQDLGGLRRRGACPLLCRVPCSLSSCSGCRGGRA